MKRKELDIRRRRLELHREQFQASTSRIHRPTEFPVPGDPEHLEDLEQLRLEMLLMREDHQLEKQMLEEENARLKKGRAEEFAPVEVAPTAEAVIIDDEAVSEVEEDITVEDGAALDDQTSDEKTTVEDADLDAVFSSPLVAVPLVTAKDEHPGSDDQPTEVEESVESMESVETVESAATDEPEETAEIVESAATDEPEETVESTETVEPVEHVDPVEVVEPVATVEPAATLETTATPESEYAPPPPVVSEEQHIAQDTQPREISAKQTIDNEPPTEEALTEDETELAQPEMGAISGTVFSVPSDIESLFDHPGESKETESVPTADDAVVESAPSSSQSEVDSADDAGDAGDARDADDAGDAEQHEAHQESPTTQPPKKRTRTSTRSEGKDASFSFHWQSDRPGLHPDPTRAPSSPQKNEDESELDAQAIDATDSQENASPAEIAETTKPTADKGIEQADLGDTVEQPVAEGRHPAKAEEPSETGREAPIPVFRSLHDMLTASGVSLPATDRPETAPAQESKGASTVNEDRDGEVVESDAQATEDQETSQDGAPSKAKGEESLVRSIVGLDPDSFSLLQELGYADLTRLSGLSSSEIRRLAEVFRIRPERIEQDWKPTARAHVNLLAASRS